MQTSTRSLRIINSSGSQWTPSRGFSTSLHIASAKLVKMGLITDFVDRQIMRHGKEPCSWIIKRSLVAQMSEQTQEGFLS
jgi:hypothetical protein